MTPLCSPSAASPPGSKSNVIPDHAVLQLKVRTYNDRTRSAILEAIERIVRAECQASGSPREPEFKLFDRYPRHPGPRRRRPRLAATVTGCRLDGDT